MNISRRQWMAGSAALAAALAAGGALAAKTLRPKSIGLQLYTVRNLFVADPFATLEQVAAIGYSEVEFGGGGYDKLDHGALRATLDRSGLTCPSIHVGYEALGADLVGTVAMAKTLGAGTIVLPWVGEAHRTADGWNEAVINMGRWAEQLAAAGLGFAYHNHDFEFTTRHGGVSMLDQLIAETDPALVKFEFDLFWAVAAGEDPKAIIQRIPGRVFAYHVKDRTPDGKMTSVGEGMIDFADIFTLDELAGVQHFYVENDQSPAPYLPDIQTSFQALSRLRA